MIIRNTSQYPTKEVRKLVYFALKGIPHRRLEVHVKNSKYAMAARFYPMIPLCSNAKLNRNYLIVARIGSEDKFPKEWSYPKRKRCQKYAITLTNWRETLIHTVAHEGEHLRQWLRRRRFREDHAERRAYKTLMKYRLLEA